MFLICFFKIDLLLHEFKSFQIGRPVVFSLAVDGEAGVRKALSMLKEELELAMSLAGCTTVKEITRSHVKTEYDIIRSAARL